MRMDNSIIHVLRKRNKPKRTRGSAIKPWTRPSAAAAAARLGKVFVQIKLGVKGESYERDLHNFMHF